MIGNREQQGAAWVEVGRHAYLEEPAEDIFFLRLRGDFTSADGWSVAAGMKGFLRDGRTRLFLLMDLTAMGDVPSSGRKAIAEAMLSVPIAATAVFGASFAQRVIATLTDRVNNLVRGSQRYETKFFSTEEQSRAWLAQKRA